MARPRAFRETTWRPRLVGARPLRPWLQARESLTARLNAHFHAVQVTGLQQTWGKAFLDEYGVLGVRANCLVWLREVVLTAQGRPLVFAHSVMTRAALRGPWCRLQKLGRVPLGAALFADARIQRGQLQFHLLSPRHALHQAVCRRFPDYAVQPLWARRSVFSRGRAQLLVTEVFLSDAFLAHAQPSASAAYRAKAAGTTPPQPAAVTEKRLEKIR